MQRVAVVGAGIAGLAAARELARAGWQVVICEKSRGVGGRVATRRVNGCIVDHGAQIIKPDGSALELVMLHELPTEELVQVMAPVRPYSDDGTLLPPDSGRGEERQFTYRSGLTMLPKLLLTSAPEGRIEVRHDTRIGLIEQEAQGMTLRDTTGSVVIQADAVIVTAPAPQAADILEASLLHDPLAPRVDALRAVPYKSCLTVILHYAAPTPEPPAYALLAANRERPLLWLAFESVKAAERAPDGGTLLIAQLGPQISRDHYRSPDEEVFALTIKELRALFGADYATPDWWQVKRWLYSQPQGQADFDVVNPPGTRVLVCGDALRPGNGRIHEAFASGLEAATRLTAAASSEY